MKKIKSPLILFIIFLISFSPISFSNLLVFSQGVDEVFDYIEINEDFEVNDGFLIPPETTVVVKKGVKISMNGGSIFIQGKLIIKGTIEEPVEIKKAESGSDYSIEVWDGGALEMMNVDVSGGGSNVQILGRKKSIFNTAYAYGLQGVVHVNGGAFVAQNVNFHDNLVAVSIVGNNSNVKVNRSKFVNNPVREVIKSGLNSVDFRYNWWGNSAGPVKNCEIYYSCWPISGSVDYSNFLTEPNFKDPIIIIPGILGSWKWTENGDWKLDPIFGTYDSLVETFEKNGYNEGENLFTFPYQWRDSNVNNAVLLKEKIQEIKEKTNWPKVDVVAHSMGGLLTREYVESNYYQDDIDQLVMLGTPNKGSPKDYHVWDGGGISIEGDNNIVDVVTEWIFKQEAKEAGFENIFDYLHNMPIKSVQELLPDYAYLKDAESGELRIYPENYPINEFLEKLNEQENMRKLNSVSVINITGKLDDDKTVGFIKVGKPSLSLDSVWEHGEPESFEVGEGDGTVPKISSEGVLFDDQKETDFLHTELPGETANIIYKKITGYSPQEEIPFAGVDNVLFVFVFSPIDIQVILPNGKWAGKNIENLDEEDQIEGAYYTGYETENEFLTIPNPENGEYKIVTEGMGDGEYKIEMAKISEDEDGETNESTAEISGIAKEGIQEEKIVEVLEDEIITEEKDSVAPIVTISSPENKTYLSDEIIPIEFLATDDGSGIDEEKTRVSLNGNVFSESEIDTAYLEEGEHNLKVDVSDKAGNISEKNVEFSVEPSIDSIISNIEKYYGDKYITKKSTKKLLDAKLRVIKNHLEVLDFIEKIPWWSKKFKNKLAKNIERLISQEISKLISDIQNKKQISKTILEPAKSILVGNLQGIMAK